MESNAHFNYGNVNQMNESSFSRQRKLATTLYLLTTSLLFADQNLLSPNLSDIAHEFNLDDLERDKQLGGDIAIAFFMIGVPASFIVGCLADIYHRRSLLFLFVILVGESACMATYWVTTYHQLYWCRALTGCSVGGALPLIYSVLGDYYSSNERGWVSGAISMGCGIGISLGQGVAGVLGPKFGWRIPFLVVSIPAVICAFLVWICVDEVERGGADKHSNLLINNAIEERHNNGYHDKQYEMKDRGLNERSTNTMDNNDGTAECKQLQTALQKTGKTNHEQSYANNDSSRPYIQLNTQISNSSELSISSHDLEFVGQASGYTFFHTRYLMPQLITIRALFKCPSVLLAIFQGAPGCIPWGIINTYLNDYLSSDRGMSVEGATLVILVFGIGNFAGTGLGGLGTSYIYSKYGARYTALLSCLSAILGCFPMWALVNSNPGATSTTLLGLIAFTAGAFSAITGPIVKSTLQNVTEPQMRGMAFALLNTFDDFGRGLGPAFVAWMIGKLDGRTKAFNIGILGWVFCGILNGMLYFTVEQDEAKVRVNILFHGMIS